jgi:hypothetical protein
MSMSMSMDYQKASPTPSPKAPAPLISAESLAPVALALVDNEEVVYECDEQSMTVVGMFLEVDTAVGKTDFPADLKQALTNALAAGYSFCNSRRLRRRDLQDGMDIQLGEISIFETAGTLHTRKSEHLHSWSYTPLPTRRFM